MISVNYITVYHIGSGYIGIHDPPINEIIRIIKNIGDGRTYEIKMYNNYDSDMIGSHYLRIFGEKNLYNISEWKFGEEVKTFKASDVSNLKKIYLKGSNYPFQLRKFCKDVSLTIQIAKEFYSTGTLLNIDNWW